MGLVKLDPSDESTSRIDVASLSKRPRRSGGNVVSCPIKTATDVVDGVTPIGRKLVDEVLLVDDCLVADDGCVQLRAEDCDDVDIVTLPEGVEGGLLRSDGDTLNQRYTDRRLRAVVGERALRDLLSVVERVRVGERLSDRLVRALTAKALVTARLQFDGCKVEHSSNEITTVTASARIFSKLRGGSGGWA